MVTILSKIAWLASVTFAIVSVTIKISGTIPPASTKLWIQALKYRWSKSGMETLWVSGPARRGIILLEGGIYKANRTLSFTSCDHKKSRGSSNWSRLLWGLPTHLVQCARYLVTPKHIHWRFRQKITAALITSLYIPKSWVIMYEDWARAIQIE